MYSLNLIADEHTEITIKPSIRKNLALGNVFSWAMFYTIKTRRKFTCDNTNCYNCLQRHHAFGGELQYDSSG